MIRVTGTLVWYYFVCKRQVWLMAQEINPFQKDPFLEIGRFLHQESYAREKKEIAVDGMKFDILRKDGGKVVVAEIKKSSKFLESATMQLCFYLYRLRKMGIMTEGEILIPEEKKKYRINLDDEKISKLEQAIEEIKKIMHSTKPPEAKKINFCKHCAYLEFCFA
ncbi:MAG: CRISPR-associated protein Cas4 [Candidatus Omnitrophica bacterium]|nr:CRISPR-associated protein Cas4 [Candidatus Omnitrophota bacterium]